jgi:hypothetical protein
VDDRPTLTLPVFVLAAIVVLAAVALIVSRVANQPAHHTNQTPVTPLAYGPNDTSRPVNAGLPAHLAGGALAAAVTASSPADAQAALEWLTEAGIPATPTTTTTSIQHPLVVWDAPLTGPAESQLAAYATRGGLVVLDRVSAEAARLAGVSRPVRATRTTITILPGGGLPEAVVAFPAQTTTGYATAAGTLARYPDGSTAIALRRVGQGVVVYVAATLRTLLLGSEQGAIAETTPGRDVLVQFARVLYGIVPNGVTLSSAPNAMSGALILEHPLATATAYRTAPPLASVEHDRGAGASFFAVTATGDHHDPAVLGASTRQTLRALASNGFDVEPGGVTNTLLGSLPSGTGAESYPAYAPAANGAGATLYGEARVSRHLAAVITTTDPTVFGPATLLTDAFQATRLDGVLASAGYTTESATPSSIVGGATPYRPFVAAGRQLAVLRLPVAFDSAAGDRVDRRINELEGVVQTALTTGAPATIRISPDGGSVATYAIEQLLAGIPSTVWVGSARAFAAFWDARYAISIDTTPAAGGWLVRLATSHPAAAQTLQFGYRVAHAQLASGAPLVISADGRRVALPAFASTLTVLVVPHQGAS